MDAIFRDNWMLFLGTNGLVKGQTEILLIIINTYLFLLIIKIFYDDTNK
jgi:hypothetical protein